MYFHQYGTVMVYDFYAFFKGAIQIFFAMLLHRSMTLTPLGFEMSKLTKIELK